jgi:hypothetical protein
MAAVTKYRNFFKWTKLLSSWLEVGITGHNFGRGPSKDHSTNVWLQLAQWFLRRFLWWYRPLTKMAAQLNLV